WPGAYHGAEIFSLFQTLAATFYGNMIFNADEIPLATSLRRYWTNMITKHQPNDNISLTWPQYSSPTDRVLVLNKNTTITSFIEIYPNCDLISDVQAKVYGEYLGFNATCTVGNKCFIVDSTTTTRQTSTSNNLRCSLWFDNHEQDFKKWSDFELAFRNHYFSSRMIHKKFDLLKQRKQLHDEPVASYFDDVVNLCKEIDPQMSELMMIKHLMSGIHSEFQKELSRRESTMNTLNEFLKYAKIEQDRSDYRRNSNYQYEPRSIFIPDKNIQYNSYQHEFKPKNYINNQLRSQSLLNHCRICSRQNHRAIDCFHKQTTGCFNCGQNHTIRECTKPPSFQ
ncbi:unnamed protein product, partial [Rotaria magnacalcarata]